MESVAERVATVPGVLHLTRADAGDGSGCVLVTADVQPGAADVALGAIADAGIPPRIASLVRLESVQQGPLRRATLVV
jgi:hypothetical protein